MNYMIRLVSENGGFKMGDFYRNGRLEFDVSNVIGDFISIKPVDVTARYDLQNHVFTQMPENDPPNDFEHGYPDYYEKHIDDVKKAFHYIDAFASILNNQRLSYNAQLRQFEEQKKSFAIYFEYTVQLKNENDLQDGIISYDVPLQNLSQLHGQDSWIEYQCRSVSGLVAAVMHFYLITGQKFIKCHHCHRYFTTTTLRRKYCNRISSYKNEYSPKTSQPVPCEQTVRNAMKYISDKRNYIYNRIRRDVPYQIQNYKYYDSFQKACDQLTAKVKANPTPDNFDEYIRFLKETNESKGWLK